MRRPSARALAVPQAFLVVFCWATSWVLIKIGLRDIPPLPFAGLRYLLAALCLTPFVLASAGARASVRCLTLSRWWSLVALGLVMAVTQGAQFVALGRLPAASLGLILGCTPVLVALLGIALLGEVPRRSQWAGMATYLAGAALYFSPWAPPGAGAAAVSVAVLGVAAVQLVANALTTVQGRYVNCGGDGHPAVVTLVTMGLCGGVLLAVGVPAQGLPAPTPAGWLITLELAVVNTALAWALWNHALRTLPAVRAGLINNTMMIHVAGLGWLFLGERLGVREVLGLAVALAGVVAVQVGRASATRRDHG
ncbi:MAG: EamA family transporter [Streptosporangiales bacterium]|nr:EamA family transporter [Streptosporangiales bacterium]